MSLLQNGMGLLIVGLMFSFNYWGINKIFNFGINGFVKVVGRYNLHEKPVLKLLNLNRKLLFGLTLKKILVMLYATNLLANEIMLLMLIYS